jgi:hypothetical protein
MTATPSVITVASRRDAIGTLGDTVGKLDAKFTGRDGEGVDDDGGAAPSASTVGNEKPSSSRPRTSSRFARDEPDECRFPRAML